MEAGEGRAFLGRFHEVDRIERGGWFVDLYLHTIEYLVAKTMGP